MRHLSTNQRYLSYALLVIFLGLLFLLATIGPAHAEAIVIPEGSMVIYPDITPNYLVPGPSFLLSRDDMEQATTALLQAPVDKKTIADLQALSNRQTAELSRLLPWSVVAVALGIIAGLVVGHVAR